MTEAEKSQTETKGRVVKMDDGRELSFGEKQKLKKDYGVREGNVFILLDFDNGKSIEVLMPAGSLVAMAAEDPVAQVALDLMGHGGSQKLGDAAAGAESTDDAFEAVLEVATRLNKGEFLKSRGEGTGSAKGASELVVALCEYLGKEKDMVREMLGKLTAADKMALRKVPEVATIIEKLRAEKAPSKKESERMEAASSLLASMREGLVPEKETATAE